MQKANPPRGKWRSLAFFLTALLVLAADQLSKLWIRSNLATGESLPETGLFRLTHVHNTGAAFGLFQNQSLLLTIIAIIGVLCLMFIGLFLYNRFSFLDTRLGNLALGFILGGTAGNLADRLYLGWRQWLVAGLGKDEQAFLL